MVSDVRKMSQDEWIAGAFEALREGGIDALRVEPLAKRLGVTKGSFYWHFDNRRALHLAMLQTWEQRSTSAVIDEIDDGASTPQQRLQDLMHRAAAPSPEFDSIETAIRAWAMIDEVVAQATQRVDNRRLDYAAKLLRSSGIPKALAMRRARLLYRTLIGEYNWRSSGGPTITKRELDELLAAVLRPPEG